MKSFNLEEKAHASYFLITQTDLRQRVNRLTEFRISVLANNKLIKQLSTR
jgi:hypothetical protein